MPTQNSQYKALSTALMRSFSLHYFRQQLATRGQQPLLSLRALCKTHSCALCVSSLCQWLAARGQQPLLSLCVLCKTHSCALRVSMIFSSSARGQQPLPSLCGSISFSPAASSQRPVAILKSVSLWFIKHFNGSKSLLPRRPQQRHRLFDSRHRLGILTDRVTFQHIFRQLRQQ